jgi:hypothetical protein
LKEGQKGRPKQPGVGPAEDGAPAESPSPTADSRAEMEDSPPAKAAEADKAGE